MGTTGNEHGHLVLRGGAAGPNYSARDIETAADLLRKRELSPRLMVDCSHANSGKDPSRQLVVAAALAAQVAAGQGAIGGIMLESHLLGGTQTLDAVPLIYGRSITDACMSWEQTLPVLALLAEAVQSRRTASRSR
jgi:3-deoxy-7-phosphoheptulonate synthase